MGFYAPDRTLIQPRLAAGAKAERTKAIIKT